MTVLSFVERKAESGGYVIATGTASAKESQRSQKTGMKLRRDSERGFKPGTTTYLM
jgi:hypothetical protein